MSPTSDLRSYADTAVNQGKQTFSTARAQFSGVTDRAHGAVSDLRASTEKMINTDSVRGALEPYVAQLRGYSHSFTDRAEELVATLKRDPRFAKLVGTAESLATVVIETVQERVVKPARSMTTGAPSNSAPEPGPADPAE